MIDSGSSSKWKEKKKKHVTAHKWLMYKERVSGLCQLITHYVPEKELIITDESSFWLENRQQIRFLMPNSSYDVFIKKYNPKDIWLPLRFQKSLNKSESLLEPVLTLFQQHLYSTRAHTHTETENNFFLFIFIPRTVRPSDKSIRTSMLGCYLFLASYLFILQQKSLYFHFDMIKNW